MNDNNLPKKIKIDPSPEDDDFDSLSLDEKAAFDKIMAEINQATGGVPVTPNTIDSPKNDCANDSKPGHSDSVSLNQKIYVDQSIMNEPSADLNHTEEFVEVNQSLLIKEVKGVSSDINDPVLSSDKSSLSGNAQELSEDQKAALDQIMEQIRPRRDVEKEETSIPYPNTVPEIKQTDLNQLQLDIQNQKSNDTTLSNVTTAIKPDANSDDQQTILDQIMADIQKSKTEGNSLIRESEEELHKAPQSSSKDQQEILDKIMAEIDAKRGDAKHGIESTNESEKSITAPNIANDSNSSLTLDQFSDELSHLLSSTQHKDKDSDADVKIEEINQLSKEDNSGYINKVHQNAISTIDISSAPLLEKNKSEVYHSTHQEIISKGQDKTKLIEITPSMDANNTSQNKFLKQQKNAIKNDRKKRKWSIFAVTSVLVIFPGVLSLHYLLNKHGTSISFGPGMSFTIIKKSNDVDVPNVPVALTVDTIPQDHAQDLVKPISTNDPLGLLILGIHSAQHQVDLKLAEIEDLKSHYRQAINDEQAQILLEVKKNDALTIDQAVQNTKIELSLRSIQRKMVYLSKLDTPLGKLHQAAEELLFRERQAKIYKILSDGTSGLPIREYKEEMMSIIDRHMQITNRLSIDEIEVAPPPIEIIWKSITTDIKKNITGASNSSFETRSEEIGSEICKGNFERKYTISLLNTNTARCLLKWDGKDLYLNEVTQLTPDVAAILSQWTGEWLSLNGLKDLSEETALQLSKWKGKRLSMNGLVRLTPEATRQLSRWKGEQLEMIGLKSIGRWENYATRLYLSEDLRRRLEVQ